MTYSVLMAVYNKENPIFLELSIESILNQTIIPGQIVIVEDGELTLELYEVLTKYELKCGSLFERVRLDKNSGLGAALNVGLSKCKHELVARMDTDDIALPNRMEMQLERFIMSPELVILGTQIIEFSDKIGDLKYSRFVPLTNDAIIRFSYTRSPFNHPTVMFKKSYIQKIGGYKEIRRKEDLDLFLRAVLIHSFRSENLATPLLYYRSNASNYKRRKSLINCKEYISVINDFRKMGYIPFNKYVSVLIMQTMLIIIPVWLQKFLSNTFFRKKIFIRR